MTTEIFNDNNPTKSDMELRGPDAHGQAAMLLVESLLHGLIARKVLSVAEAVEIVATAAEIKVEVAAEWGDSPATMLRSLDILGAIQTSLQRDIADK
ncbi:hypothetical protein [Mesorhizobium sp. CN2-181]|uniref:hypothetical protein n=1 Tax=Mesorhizobium yinganensis TaxID=3157707 RepID=UPI0032B8126F